MKTIFAIPVMMMTGLMLLVASVAAQDEAYRNSPGYFEFGDVLEYSDGDELVEIDLSQPLLGLLGAVMGSEDPELADLMRELELVKVNMFSYDRDSEGDLTKLVDDLNKRLKSGDWQNIVRVRGEEDVNVFVKMGSRGDGNNPDDATFQGLTVLFMDDYEAVFVNVVGEFGLDEIARVGRHFDIPHLEDIDSGRDDDDRRDRRRRGG